MEKDNFHRNTEKDNFLRNTEHSTTHMTRARGFCLEHPEEEISYFCFDCLTDCICPECVIHGVHKNHEV